MCFDLIDVTKDDRLKSIKILIEHIKKLGKDWLYIYIGKTHIKGNKLKPFDKTNQETWDLKAIQNRKSDHSINKGLTNLTVISVITNAEVPSHSLLQTRSIEHNILMSIEEQYALSLESEIINQLRFSDFGAKLVNVTSNAGNLKKKDCDGFVIYMAYGNTLSEAYICTLSLPITPCELTPMSTSIPLISSNQSYEFEDITPVNSPGSIIHNEEVMTPPKSQQQATITTLKSDCAEFTNTSPLTHCDSRQEQSLKFQDMTLVNSPSSNTHKEVTAPVFLPPVLTDDLKTSQHTATRFTRNISESPQTSLYAHNSSVTSSRNHRRSKCEKQYAKQRHETTPYQRKRSTTSVVFYGIDTGQSTDHFYDRKRAAYNQIRRIVKKLPQIDTNDWKDAKLWTESMTLLGKKSHYPVRCPVCIDFHSEQTATEILNNNKLFRYHKIGVKPFNA